MNAWLLAVSAFAQDVDIGLWAAVHGLAEERPIAVARCDAVREVLHGVAVGVSVDPASASLVRRVRDATIELDLGALHDMLPMPEAGARALHVHGHSLGPRGYAYTLFPTAAQREADHALLDVGATLRMAPAVHAFGGGDGYAVHQSVRVGTGALDAVGIARAAEIALATLHARVTDGAVDLGAAGRWFPELTDPTSLAVVDVFADAAPRLTERVSTVLRLERVASVSNGALDLGVDARVDLPGLAASGYPALARFLDRMDDVLRLDLSVRDGHGHAVVDVSLRSAQPGMSVRALTRGGALVPRGGLGPVDHELRWTDPAIDLRIGTDLEVRVEGILLRITGIEVPVAYRLEDGAASFATEITHAPILEFTGTHAVSRWFAELADRALSLEAQGQVVFRALTEGEDGRGARGRATFVGGEVRGAVDLLLVDNGLIRFGTRMVGRYLAPEDAVVEEGMQLLSRWIEDLERDYAAVRPAL